MSQHTPGPWRVKSHPRLHVDRHICVDIPSGFARIIAKVCHTDVDDALANARLIAAAPEMKDAIFGLLLLARHEVWCVRFTQGDEDCTCFINKARALLAKVEGER
mgnify:CR=1 FL=1